MAKLMNVTAKITNLLRTNTIKFRVTDDEFAEICNAAGNTAVAVFVRSKVLADAAVSKRHQRKTPLRNEKNAGCAALSREVARIGNNLNQLSRSAHIATNDGRPIDLVLFAVRLQKIWEELHVLQSIQTGQRQGDGDRLLDEFKGCQRDTKSTSSTPNAREYGNDEEAHS
jgi:hypothetical protein